MAGRPKKTKKIWEDMLKEASPEPSPPTEEERNGTHYGQRCSNFLVMLYPDCQEHMAMLDYLEQYSNLFQIVYILHDRDVWDEEGIEELRKKQVVGEYTEDLPNVGDLKKPHYHVLIHKKTPQSLATFKDFFSPWVRKVVVCRSVEGSILYFMHRTPQSINKPVYYPEELHGDARMINSVTQNGHFV